MKVLVSTRLQIPRNQKWSFFGENSVVLTEKLEKIFDHHYKWYQKKVF